jgi:hypothetical protein
MKTLSVDESVRTDPKLADAVLVATGIVEEELGNSAEQVEVSWRLTHDQRGRPIVVLRLSDWTGSVDGNFSPDELKDTELLGRRVVRLWGDLLQVRSREQMKALAKTPLVEEEADALTQIEDAVSEFTEREGREPRFLRLPVRYAVELMKLGPSYWGEDFQAIRRRGTRAFENLELLGMRIQVVPGVHAKLEME